MNARRTIREVAEDMLKCAVSHEPGSRLIGNVMASEIALLASAALTTCPSCGAEAWVNIDCDLCGVCSAIWKTSK